MPVSQLLPYPAMIVPFTYSSLKPRRIPTRQKADCSKTSFGAGAGLAERYSRSLDTRLAQDIKKIDAILKGNRPAYDWEVNASAEYIEQNGYFATGRGDYIKTLLCLLASKRPLSFRDNSVVNISNDWLTRSNSKNYHHFFSKEPSQD